MSDALELLSEQRERWESGTRTRVETLLGERPGLSDELALDLIYNEIVLREESGETPTYEEYAARFPAFAAELRLQFQVHDAFGRAAPPDATPSLPGYEIVDVLGRGGMGVVYAAKQTSLGRRVAIKVLPSSANSDRDALARFESEARTASSLNHPNVATVFDFGTHAGQPFIVMELVTGTTLAKLVTESPPPERSVEIVRQIARALAAAHAAGIVHRDLKPANVMVRDDELVKVLDFGLARLTRPGTHREHSGVIAGTPRYMSPEQLRGDPVETATDVYSLGLVFRELLGAHALHGGLIARMTADTPSERPTMAEILDELTPAPHVPRPRRTRILAAAALAAALLAIPLTYLATRRAPAPSPRATPSIVVIPFATVGDSAAAYFSAGVTEDVTSMLARAPDIDVRSLSAALAYKDTPVDVQRIGRELGVGYVLEGSVRKDAHQVRITARLVDTRTGQDVWAERLDRTGDDPWALQDELAGHIVGALTGEYGQLKRAQYRAAWGTDSTQLGEYDLYLRGHELYMRLTPDDNDRAAEVWRNALVTYPDSALLETKLGFAHFMRPFLFLRDDAAADYTRAGELVRRALARPHVSPLANRLAHWLYAYVSAQERNYERALREMETTLALGPYDMFALGDLSTIPILAGKPDEALRMLDKALAADAANKSFYQQLRGWALSVAGRYAESAAALAEAIELPMVPLLQAVNYVELGRLDDARALVAKALATRPDLSRAKWRSANPYRDTAVLERQLAHLAAAGLP